MIRILLWLSFISVLYLTHQWFVVHPGAIHAEWLGWRIDTSFYGLTVILILVIAILIPLRWILNGLKSLFGGRSQRKELKAQEMLMKLTALDYLELTQEAALLDQKIQRLLPVESPLHGVLRVLRIQRLISQNRFPEARSMINTLSESNLHGPKALGLSFLYSHAKEHGDEQECWSLLQELKSLYPKSPWILKEHRDLAIDLEDWDRALDALQLIDKHSLSPRVETQEYKSLAWYEKSLKTTGGTALGYAAKAYEASPEFVEVVTQYAKLLLESDSPRKAKRILEEAFTKDPQRDFALLYADIGDQSPLSRFSAMESLSSFNKTHPETHLLMAEFALKASIWGQGKRHLDEFKKTCHDPLPHRYCVLWADYLEATQSNISEIREWDLKAVGRL